MLLQIVPLRQDLLLMLGRIRPVKLYITFQIICLKELVHVPYYINIIDRVNYSHSRINFTILSVLLSTDVKAYHMKISIVPSN